MNNLYDTDFHLWSNEQAKFLKKGEFLKLDINNLLEEILDLGKRERDKFTSYLENLLLHELKAKYQKEKHTRSWDLSIKEAKFKARKVLKQNPSLKPYLKDFFKDAYYSACLRASSETGLEENTFPSNCEWSIKDIFPDVEEKYF